MSAHIHGHSHNAGSHHHDGHEILGIFTKALVEHVFVLDPVSNAILAVALLTGLTQTFIALSPKLSGPVLQFFIAFATGSMLGTVFLHMMPETHPSQFTSLLILAGFLFFVVVDKIVRICSDGNHSHSHSEPPAPSQPEHSSKHTHTNQHENGEGEKNVSPWLNILADSLHNLTEGISLVLAFNVKPAVGVSSFLIMGAHEIPHQFGDFALLLSSGLQKSVARRAQLFTALGTLVGILLGHWFGTMGLVLNELITPVAMGVFLYVATINVLPELLETDRTRGVVRNIGTGIVQLSGILTGIWVLTKLGHEH